MVDEISYTNTILAVGSSPVIIGLLTYSYKLFQSYVSQRKRLIYGLYNELLYNKDLLDSCINRDRNITTENIPRLVTQYYQSEFSNSRWTRFLKWKKTLHIPDRIKSEEMRKRFHIINSRPFLSSVHSLFRRARLLNYIIFDSLEEGRNFNKDFRYKTRLNNIFHDLFILVHNLEQTYDYLGEDNNLLRKSTNDSWIEIG